MKRPLSFSQILLVSVFVGMLAVATYNTKDIIFGAPLKVGGISSGDHVAEGYLTLSGSAPHARLLSVNGRAVSIDRQGMFSEPVLLAPGYNVLEIDAIDRFGNTTTKRIEVVRSESEGEFTFTNRPIK